MDTKNTPLTAKEIAMLDAIANCDQYDDGTYAFVVCETRSGAAVFGSLVKKGLATSAPYEGDMWLSLTGAGYAALAAAFEQKATPTTDVHTNFLAALGA